MKEVSFGRIFAGAGAEAQRSTVSERGTNQKGALHQCSGMGEDVSGQQTELKNAQLGQHGTSCGVGCQQISRAGAKYLLILQAPLPHAPNREVHHGKTQSMT